LQIPPGEKGTFKIVTPHDLSEKIATYVPCAKNGYLYFTHYFPPLGEILISERSNARYGVYFRRSNLPTCPVPTAIPAATELATAIFISFGVDPIITVLSNVLSVRSIA
jgi:hypothetical protein